MLHERLTIITGPNGSGKSTILNLLGGSLTDDPTEQYLATPVSDSKTKRFGFSLSTLFKKYNPFLRENDANQEQEIVIGKIHYSDKSHAQLVVPARTDLQYRVKLRGQKKLPGFKIGSHTAVPAYQQVNVVPVRGIGPKDAFEYYRNVQKGFDRGQTYQPNARQNVTNPVAPLKETLIGLVAFGSSNDNMRANPDLEGVFEGFREKLKDTLPSEIGFQGLEVRGSEVVVASSAGDFPIDGSSGGLMAIIQIVWQIFLFTTSMQGKAVVLIDEPENHLHPSLQRDFLSKLVDAFSNVQFIVATHSPFIVSSVKESFIFALQFGGGDDTAWQEESGDTAYAVTASQIDMRGRAGAAPDILERVLGVPVTIPIWAESELSEIVNEFSNSNLDVDSIQRLKARLESSGLESFFPEAIAKWPR